jgi:hypothetical protein
MKMFIGVVTYKSPIPEVIRMPISRTDKFYERGTSENTAEQGECAKLCNNMDLTP